MKKRVLSAMLAMAMTATVLSGCGKSETESSTADSKEPEHSRIFVCFLRCALLKTY